METIYWTFQSAAVTLKIRSRSPKLNQLFLSSQQCIYAKLVKIHPLVQKINMETIFWTFQSGTVTLKIRSRSSKFDQLFPSSQQCIYASLVKIHPLVQKITHRNHILDILSLSSTLPLLPTMYLCKLGQNPSTGSEDNAWK